MALAPNTRLGPYEVLAPLGAGGMGEVYRARDTRLGREVAIKSLPEGFSRDPERLARFLREAQTLAALSHPNIATLYGLEESDSGPHLVLELIDGETLASRIARGPLEPAEAIAVLGQVAAAIEAAHERGVIHRDLKPGNVMVTPSGIAKVLDFGLAKLDAAAAPSSDSTQAPTMAAYDGATVAGAILGTAAYMSPEQARGRAVDRRCDVWAFGCLLYESLTGRAAFTGETASDLIARILEREPDYNALPAHTPPALREVVRRCLRKDADARPRDIRDVRLELAQAAAPAARFERASERSIAVIPFENQSSSEDDYFTDGMTDEILNALTHIAGLRVAARSSCFAFKGRREDPRMVGEKLDVATVLEGSVRRAGSRLRITVQLVNVADGYQVWSERYDRELTDVFELQDEIANAIAKRLKGDSDSQNTPAAPRAGTRSLEAYDALLRGRALQSKRGRYVHEAMRCFEQALALDPDYIEPRAWLADSHRLLGTFGAAPFHEAMQLSKRYSREALQRDPDAAEVWGTLAALSEQYDWAYEASDRYSERLYALEPDHARGMCQQALWHLHRGAWTAERATALTARAVEIDPLNAWIGGMHSFCLAIAGRHDEAIVLAERAHALDPESFFPHVNVMLTYTLAGRLEDAVDLGPEVLRNSGRQPWALGAYGCALGAAGRLEQAAAVLDEMLARRRHEFCGTGWMATIAGHLGREDQALELTRLAVEEHDPTVVWARVGPFWTHARRFEGFDAIVAEVYRDHSGEVERFD